VASASDRAGILPSPNGVAQTVLHKPWIVPIPGKRNMDHLHENLEAVDVQLTPVDLREIETA
jgi:aryl-alcohol dehydrogenase-like predicted oxidoreductase